MQIPLEITYRHIEASTALEEKIRQRVAKLERFNSRITSCRVIVEAPHQHQHQGNRFHVRIDITVPGNEIVVSRDPEARQDHQDAYVAVRDAFNAAERQLEDHTRRRRGKIKSHAAPPQGRICELEADHGRIETADGRLVYFHRNSLVEGRFDHLALGTEVRFHEVRGADGPRASTVHLIGK